MNPPSNHNAFLVAKIKTMMFLYVTTSKLKIGVQKKFFKRNSKCLYNPQKENSVESGKQ